MPHILAVLLLLQNTKCILTSGPLHLFSLPGKFVFQIFAWIITLHYSVLCSNICSSNKPPTYLILTSSVPVNFFNNHQKLCGFKKKTILFSNLQSGQSLVGIAHFCSSQLWWECLKAWALEQSEDSFTHMPDNWPEKTEQLGPGICLYLLWYHHMVSFS